ncbi:MAG: tyrosine-protein phosphatase, partial [Eubacteriales bacterium]|nr:tyrosine-protein phosphatase [Eubacteriales bacterium]
GSVLWHCTGGKDRAGLTAAILLSILGVDEETILADFTLTNEVLNEKIAYITGEAAKHTSDEDELEQIAALIGVSADHMQMVFDRARAECGSMAAFVQQKIGLSDDEVQMLRQRYLE